MFQENIYKSLLPKNAHSSPTFDKAACTMMFSPVFVSSLSKLLLANVYSTDKEVAVDFDENNNLADVEPLIANMEKMKR